jgi:hypothetical protein
MFLNEIEDIFSKSNFVDVLNIGLFEEEELVGENELWLLSFFSF